MIRVKLEDNPVLKMSHIKAEKLLTIQINKGNSILKKINKIKNLSYARREYKNWKKYNYNLLKKIFDSNSVPNNYYGISFSINRDNIDDIKKYLIKDIEKLNNISSRLRICTVKKKEYLIQKINVKEIIYNPYTVRILGGLVVLVLGFYITKYFLLDNNSNSKENGFTKPYYEIDNYKIKVNNKNYVSFDTLALRFVYQGSKIILNRNFKLVNYKFTNKEHFYLGSYNNFDPKLEISETIIKNAIIDSTNSKQIVLIQIKRKMIFGGYDMAYFKTTDKKIIGSLKIAFDYKLNNRKIKDTIETKIYLEK